MPIYEYECEKCNTTFEIMQSVSAKPLKTCTGLGCKGRVHRLVSTSGFILKGSGWYTSDYPSEARKKGWESESQQATSGKKSNDTSADKTSVPEPTVTTAEKTSTKQAKKKPDQKNPYSGTKKPRAKTSK